MGFDFEKFEDFCSAEHATMLARECGSPTVETILPCRHELEGGQNSLASKELAELLPEHVLAQFEVFYSHHASAKLFVVEDEAGVYLAPPKEWPSLFHEAHEWWHQAVDELEDDERSLLQSAVVFGRIPRSATFFLLASNDAFPGVFLFTGPGLEIRRIADSFGDLLEKMPSEGLGWMRPDVRYCYDDRGLQFHPVEYREKHKET